MLSLRLKTIADMIPEKTSRLIDVGCDHALLDIYLAKKYSNMEFLATDVNNNALSAAIKNIENNNLTNRIATKLTNGLEKIDLRKKDYIVISGMGTKTILEILENHVSKIENIIIQSNRDLEQLRLYMFNNAFDIIEEKTIFDKKHYVIIHFQKIKFARLKHEIKRLEEDYWLGPQIKNSNNKSYFQYLLSYYEELLETIPCNIEKYESIKIRIDYLKELIEKK